MSKVPLQLLLYRQSQGRIECAVAIMRGIGDCARHLPAAPSRQQRVADVLGSGLYPALPFGTSRLCEIRPLVIGQPSKMLDHLSFSHARSSPAITASA